MIEIHATIGISGKRVLPNLYFSGLTKRALEPRQYMNMTNLKAFAL